MEQCQHFIGGECTHTESVKKLGKFPSPGGHKGCTFNTTGGIWPTINAKPPPMDPTALANLRRATGGCHGCGDSPMEGV